jgi:hypothetical protein
LQARGHEVLALTDEKNQRPVPVNACATRQPPESEPAADAGPDLLRTYRARLAARGAAARCATARLYARRDLWPFRLGRDAVSQAKSGPRQSCWSTFVNRNLEPYRGYHVFMRALPDILAARPKAQVVIVGEDGVSYGKRPEAGGKWKDIFLNEVKDRLDLSRVHFTGRLPYDRLVDLMHVSRAHAYLTYPFVLSWSMVETLAAGTLVVGSNTAPVAEVIKDGVNGRLVDFFDIKGWSDTLTDALARPEAYVQIRQNARDMTRAKYDLRSVCLPQQIALLTRLERS